jgi:hypothetical protein
MDDPEAALAELCDHLVATGERPVERRLRRLLEKNLFQTDGYNRLEPRRLGNDARS